MLAHVVGENSSVNSGCNFRRTGGFCAVADNTADVSNGVDDRQTDIFISSARKIGNGGTGSTACADGAAVSGKTSNIFFLMNRNQVADNECAVQFFLGNVPFFCKLNDRKGNGHALVSAAGIDDDRKRAAAHTRIGACRCTGAGADFYVIAVFIQQRAANLCTVWMTETFIGNGRVHGDLTVKNFFDVFDLHSIGKFKNILDVQHTFINVFRGILMSRNLIKYLTIFYDA